MTDAARHTRPTLRDAMAAVDADAENVLRAPLTAPEVSETARDIERKRLENFSADRLALSINIVLHAEQQRGRPTVSRKGAATVVLIKALLDKIHDDDIPVTYKEFAPLGGGASVDMSALADLLAGKQRAQE